MNPQRKHNFLQHAAIIVDAADALGRSSKQLLELAAERFGADQTKAVADLAHVIGSAKGSPIKATDTAPTAWTDRVNLLYAGTSLKDTKKRVELLKTATLEDVSASGLSGVSM